LTLARQKLEALYRAHAANAFRRARSLLGQSADAHEVVHDVFLSLAERPEQHAGHSRMSTFLYSAVTHACLNRMRNGKTRERLLALHGDALAPSDRGRPSADQLFQLRALIERLPEPLAQVAVYRYMDELTHEEIAEIMGCSRRHVGDLLKRLDDMSEARESAE
jgi:RNA polymerase sigma factor (sigma-70 family)